jgi:alkanesulfonate monooxygenase SsuD/methylene tetrahydromethanopterin reductase-like flavin-dependent oxidoreductase (luciferase family)
MEDRFGDRSLRERVGMTVWATDPTTLVAVLAELEEAGVDQVWVPFGPPWSPDLLTVLAAAAARTTHLKLGTAIVPVYSRHPVLLALQVLSLSDLAPQRLRLGLGIGAPELAKRVYGVDMESPLSYMCEYVQLLRPLLHQGEVHHHEHFFRADISLPTSTQIPILMAALGPAAFRLAGEIADGVLPFLCPIPYLLDTALPALHAGASKASRPRPPIVAHVPVALTEDRALALQVGRQAFTAQTTFPFYRKMFLAAGFSTQEIDAVSDTFVERLLVFGGMSQIKDRLLEFLGRGVDELTIGPVWVSDAAQERSCLAQLIGHL